MTNNFVNKAGLEKIPAEYYLQLVGENRNKVQGPMYAFDMITNKGKQYSLCGYGIDKITDVVAPVDLSEVRSLFPHLPDQVFQSLDEKPLDILVGLNFLGLHPEG